MKGKIQTVAYKRIQGGIQSDITLRITSNFSWYIAFLSLHQFDPNNTNKEQPLPFRVEKLHGTRSWMVCRKGCFVRSWHHKRYTSVRIQFFKHYCGRRLQFTMQIGDMHAATTTPIVVYNVFGLTGITSLGEWISLCMCIIFFSVLWTPQKFIISHSSFFFF